jgi:tetratricopeptide (TPR) repeat protein
MPSERPDRDSIFCGAIEIASADERAAYIAGACGGDDGLRREVEKLVAAHFQAGSFLEQPAVPPGGLITPTDSMAAPAADSSAAVVPGGGEKQESSERAAPVLPAAERAGSRIGPYKLLQQIGEGGMGVVWMAEQQEPVRRRVALKVIKPGMDSGQVIARFEAERQALALMDHVNIARVLDAGTTGSSQPLPDGRVSGRPYFVMELVHGVPITRYCDDNHLTPRERLELFVPVCQALQHAHQKGIIHRDVKPSNVLVTLYDGRAVPKVIDFGIAKATEQRLTERTLFTNYGTVVGTPEYMSPEQAGFSALGVDTRSDIYSLGVLLYELLTGSTPLQRKRLREVAFAEAMRLIQEEEPPRPSTRLSSSDTLPAIAAARKTEPAKLTRLVRGELDWIVMKCLEKDRTRRYETASGLARDVQRYLTDEPVEACPPSAGYLLRKFIYKNRKLLGTAAAFLLLLLLGGAVTAAQAVRLAQAEREEARRALSAAQEEAARAGAIEADLERGEAALRMKQLTQAAAALGSAEARLVAGAPEELRRRARLLKTDVDTAQRLEAIPLQMQTEQLSLRKTSRPDSFLLFVSREHLKPYRSTFAGYGLDFQKLDADGAAERIRTSAIKDYLISALFHWVNIAIAVDLTEGKALEAVLEKADEDPWRRQLLEAFRKRDRRAVEKLADRPEVTRQSPMTQAIVAQALLLDGATAAALRLLRKVHSDHPNDPAINEVMEHCLLLMDPPRWVEAIGYLRALVALRPKYWAAWRNLGAALYEVGDLSGAEAAYRKVIDLRPNDALAQSNLGSALLRQGKLAEAGDAFRKASACDPSLAEALSGLGEVLYAQGRHEQSKALFEKAIGLKPDLPEAHNNLGHVLFSQGKIAEARPYFEKAIFLRPLYPEAHNNLGQVLFGQGNLAGAEGAFRKAIQIKPDYAPAYQNLGAVLLALGRWAEAEAVFRESLRLEQHVAMRHDGLGMALRMQGKLAEAVKAHQQAVKLQPDHPGLRDSLRHARRLLKLESRLPALLRGEEKLSDTERMLVLELCSVKRLYVSAVRLYRETFARQPALAEDPGLGHRYNAACAAALAAAGTGEDAGQLSASERTGLRKQALAWLQADLEAWRQRLEKEPASARPAVLAQLDHWEHDLDFSSVRGAAALARLPESERRGWQKLWDDVAAVLVKARGEKK